MSKHPKQFNVYNYNLQFHIIYVMQVILSAHTGDVYPCTCSYCFQTTESHVTNGLVYYLMECC